MSDSIFFIDLTSYGSYFVVEDMNREREFTKEMENTLISFKKFILIFSISFSLLTIKKQIYI